MTEDYSFTFEIVFGITVLVFAFLYMVVEFIRWMILTPDERGGLIITRDFRRPIRNLRRPWWAEPPIPRTDNTVSTYVPPDIGSVIRDV